MFNFYDAISGGSVKAPVNEKKVSLEEAKDHFEKFYNQRSKGYEAMAKKRDGERKKDGKWLLIPNSPESYKNLTENGVLYYDMLGVDAFNGKTFTMKDNDGDEKVYETKTEPKKKYQDLFHQNLDDRTQNPVNFRWIKVYNERIEVLNAELISEKDKQKQKKIRNDILDLYKKIGKLENSTDSDESDYYELDSESDSD